MKFWNRKTHGGLLLCAAVAVLLAGCGGSSSPESPESPGDEEAAGSSPTSPEPEGDDQASGTPEPSSSPAESPSPSSPSDAPSTPSFPEATDGTDLAACEDGRCEVLITVDESIQLPEGAVLLGELTADEFTFVFGTAGSLICNVRCSTSSSGGGPTTVTATEGSFDTSDSRLTVVAFDAEALVLRVEPLS